METRISTVGLMKNNVFCDFLRFFVIFAVFCDFRVFLDFQAISIIFRPTFHDEDEKLHGNDVEVDDYDRNSHAGRFRSAGQTSQLT